DPRLSRVLDDASRWRSTAREREGTRYLGIPQNPSYRMRQSNPDAQASRSRDSPDIENPAHGAALSDLGPPPAIRDTLHFSCGCAGGVAGFRDFRALRMTLDVRCHQDGRFGLHWQQPLATAPVSRHRIRRGHDLGWAESMSHPCQVKPECSQLTVLDIICVTAMTGSHRVSRVKQAAAALPEAVVVPGLCCCARPSTIRGRHLD